MTRRHWILLAGGVVAVLVLAGAAFSAASLLTPGSLNPLAWVGLGASPNQRNDYQLITATELPPTQPEVAGPVTAIQTITVIPKAPANVSAPARNVVITPATKVYRDTTRDGGLKVVDGKVQQLVEPYDASLIKAGDGLLAWGDTRGDRLTATTVVVIVNQSQASAP